MNIFQDFLQTVENQVIKNKLSTILIWIESTYPNLEPVIKWSQPMFVHQNTFIIGFSAAKKHINIAPEAVTLTKFQDEIKDFGYHQTKMLIQVKENQDINYDLLKRMIDFNIEDKKGLSRFWR